MNSRKKVLVGGIKIDPRFHTILKILAEERNVPLGEFLGALLEGAVVEGDWGTDNKLRDGLVKTLIFENN